MIKSNDFFLCVGPEKTGTTWLHKNLNSHPSVILPRVKELRFFWERDILKKRGITFNVFGNHWHHRSQRLRFRSEIKQHLIKLFTGHFDLNDFKWDIRHFFGKRTDLWYASLFPNESITGDISPHNAFLDEDSIKSIRNNYGNVRIIISLRDPIEREWSRAKMNLMRKRNKRSLSQVSFDEFVRHLSDPKQVQLNDYAHLIEKWEKYFDKVHVFYFDELEKNPQRVFDDVCSFLGLSKFEIESIDKPVNKGSGDAMPSTIYNKILELNYNHMLKFHDTYPSQYSRSWVEKHRSAYEALATSG